MQRSLLTLILLLKGWRMYLFFFQYERKQRHWLFPQCTAGPARLMAQGYFSKKTDRKHLGPQARGQQGLPLLAHQPPHHQLDWRDQPLQLWTQLPGRLCVNKHIFIFSDREYVLSFSFNPQAQKTEASSMRWSCWLPELPLYTEAFKTFNDFPSAGLQIQTAVHCHQAKLKKKVVHGVHD